MKTPLTSENYFSTEMSLHYMGSSQFKSFQKCEAATMEEINGEYEREKTISLYVGSYVDAYFEGNLNLFMAQNPFLFKKDGCLKSDYIKADEIIQRIEQDPFFMKYMAGEKQVIKTGEIDGIPFKIKIDSYHQKKAIVDLKVMKDFVPIYIPERGRCNFIEAWGYDIQGAIYQEVEGSKLPFYIAGVTKEKETDLAIIKIDQSYLDVALGIVKAEMPRFQKIKKGEIQPNRCEKCAYCRHTKILSNVWTMEDLDDYMD